MNTTSYAGKAAMLIRKPVADVFAAVIDPAITTRFWFTKSNGKLEKGKRVQWEWEMYGVNAQVDVIELDVNKRVVIEWSSMGQPPTRVEWLFTARGEKRTFVEITQSGFRGGVDEIVAQAIDSTGGFAFHLAGMKALLEHGIELNLTGDHHPKD